MFAQPLKRFSDSDNNYKHEYALTDHSYGKDKIKVLHVNRDGPTHIIREFEVNVHLKLNDQKEYRTEDNSDIVCSDSQRDTVYLLAKKFGIENAEKFALLLGNHYLNRHSHIDGVSIHVEEYPWQRISRSDLSNNTVADASSNQQLLHNHAFIFSPTELHYCDVVLWRTDSKPTIISGIKELHLLKTAQSSFVNFLKDDYRTLPDQFDRICGNVVGCCWEYSDTENIDYYKIWRDIRSIILKKFAGDTVVGVSLKSTQNTVYLIEKEILDVIPQVAVVSMTMPSKTYTRFDTKPFQKLVPGDNNEVFIPSDKPHSTVYAQLARKDLITHL